MVSLSLIMTALTAVALVFGALFGMMRGRNRSILRLIMIIACIVAAFLLRGVVLDTIMGIETPEGTLKEMLVAGFNQGDNPLPQSIQNLVFALIEMLVGLVSYFVLFFALRFISGIILFPILKIFVRKGLKKGVLFGGVVGLIQGVVIAFAVLVPLNGLFLTVNEISKIEIEDKPIVEMPSELGFDEFVNSPISKLYGSVGGWYFDSMTNVKMEDGKELNIGDACDMVTTVTGLASSVTEITESMDVLSKETAKPEEKVEAAKEVGQKLMEIGDKIDNLSDDATEVINGIIDDVKQMIQTESEGNSEGLDELFDNLNLEELNLKSVGQGLTGIATYIEKTELKTEETEEVTQDDVNNIVQGLAGSTTILDLISSSVGGEGTPELVPVPEEHQEMFKTAIESIEEEKLTSEQKQMLKDMFGVK